MTTSLFTNSDFQDGAIASRLLLKAAGGSVTTFAVAAGEGLPEHSTPREALLVVLHGTAEVAIDGTPRTLASGEAIHLPAAVPHSVHAPGAMRMLLVTLAA